MNNPRISVVIPTYNRAGYIENALDSVFNQTYQDFEIIICDDSSNDNTLEVINSIKAKSKLPIHVEVLPKNLGVSAARNKAIFLAKGELIAFLDSDDSWKSEKLEKQVDFLDKNSDFIGVGCSFNIYDGYEILEPEKPPLVLEKHNELYQLLYQCYITTSCFLVRKESLILAGLFDLKLKQGQDRDLWWRLPRLGRIGFINEALVKYRVHKASISKMMSSSTGKTYVPTIQKTVWYWKDSLSSEEQRQIISNAHLLVSLDAFESNKYSLCIKHALKSIFYRSHLSQATKLIIISLLNITGTKKFFFKY